MPTKKNRGGHPDGAPFSIQSELGQPSHFGSGLGPLTGGSPPFLFDQIKSGTATKGGGSSAVGRLSHGTDSPNKVSLPRGKSGKTRGLYPKAK